MKKTITVIMMLTLTGCITNSEVASVPSATSTTNVPLSKLYRKAHFFNLDSNYGYRDWRDGKSGYKINYKGVEGLHSQVTLDLALLRASELCMKKNYQYFGLTKVSTFYEKKRYQKEFTPHVIMHLQCFNNKFNPALYDTKSVWKEINHKILTQNLDGYKSIVKKKPKSKS